MFTLYKNDNISKWALLCTHVAHMFPTLIMKTLLCIFQCFPCPQQIRLTKRLRIRFSWDGGVPTPGLGAYKGANVRH